MGNKTIRKEFRVDDFAIRLRWENQAAWEAANDQDKAQTRPTYWIDFEIFAIVGRKSDDSVLYYRKGADFELSDRNGVDPLTESLDESEPSVHGFVKWDGCTQMWFDDQPVHFDERISMEQLFAAIAECRKQALIIMKDEGEEYSGG